jgi:MOSC domain-containing protein YiiM
MSESLQELFDTLPQVGRVCWIAARPQRGAPMTVVDAIEAHVEHGLVGDRYASRNGKRQVTLIQWEHLPVMASLLGRAEIAPELLRRNIAIAGINLLALKDKRFSMGDAILAPKWKHALVLAVTMPCAAMAGLLRGC